ncbi:MAG: gamma-glutamylcyclotransferase [Pseudohongiellaceae bacterium]
MPEDKQNELETRLFVYGTLAPGESNAHIMAGLNGRWEVAELRGYVYPDGLEASEWYPALILPGANDDSAPTVSGRLFVSADLPEFWPQLDAFEGACYQRVVVSVTGRDSGAVDAYVYELNQPTGNLDGL